MRNAYYIQHNWHSGWRLKNLPLERIQICLQGFIDFTHVSYSENTLRHVTLFYLILSNTEHFFSRCQIYFDLLTCLLPTSVLRQYPGRMKIDHATSFHLLRRRCVGRKSHMSLHLEPHTYLFRVKPSQIPSKHNGTRCHFLYSLFLFE